MPTLMDALTVTFSLGAPAVFVCALSCLWTSMRAAHADRQREEPRPDRARGADPESE